jgi:hypothetical protein
MKLDEWQGSWKGTSELWEDPLGNVVQKSDCTIVVEDGVVSYTWSYQGKAHRGVLKLTEEGGSFEDSWHQAEPVACEPVSNPRSIATVQYSYMETWGWRINLCHRDPTGELVLQMTNIAPWGEEARAVRMVCKRSEP